MGAYDRDVVDENGKLLLRFAEDNNLTPLNTFFALLKVAYPTHSKAQTAAKA